MKNLFLLIFILFSLSVKSAPKIKNKKSVSVNISGNCGMCKNTIETAANIKKEVFLSWDKESKMATVTFDSLKTSLDEILRRVADAGYDNQMHKTNEDIYNRLHGCCKYDRAN